MTKNIVVFVIVSAAILAGWIFLQPQLDPAKKKGDDKKGPEIQAKKDDKEKKAEPPAKKDKADDAKDVKKQDAQEAKAPTPPAVEIPAPDAVKVFTLGDDQSFLK